MRARRLPADAEPPCDASTAETLGWFFRRNGVLRQPNSVRRIDDGRRYKKGYEVRLVAFNSKEFADIRALLQAAGFVNLGRPFLKTNRTVQPLYGKTAVIRFLTLIGEMRERKRQPRRKRRVKRTPPQ